jgi:hypothetical protein
MFQFEFLPASLTASEFARKTADERLCGTFARVAVRPERIMCLLHNDSRTPVVDDADVSLAVDEAEEAHADDVGGGRQTAWVPFESFFNVHRFYSSLFLQKLSLISYLKLIE